MKIKSKLNSKYFTEGKLYSVKKKDKDMSGQLRITVIDDKGLDHILKGTYLFTNFNFI